MTVPVKVLVVDDHPVARRGVASLLAEAFPVLEIRETGTTAEAITIATRFQPNLVVLDLRTPDPPGPAATCAALKERSRHSRIVILTAFRRPSRSPSMSSSVTSGASPRGVPR